MLLSCKTTRSKQYRELPSPTYSLVARTNVGGRFCRRTAVVTVKNATYTEWILARIPTTNLLYSIQFSYLMLTLHEVCLQ